MKYILSAALLLALFSGASAQSGPQLKVVRTVRNVTASESSNMQIIMDKIQQQTESTLVYPLIRMTNAAINKVHSLQKAKHARIRTNNNPKRAINPNRA